MSDLSVSERRIKPIQDAVESENWKQALQICEKWQKKGEKSDRFQAIKAFVLVKQPDASTHQRGVQETVQLCRRTPAITDVDALHQIQDTLKEISLSVEEGPKLWDRAVAAKPEDKDLATTWLNRSIAENNWLGAQKAAMALRKAFPTDRNYDFWNILMCYLIHTDHSRSDRERTLFGNLAYRMISKAAEGVPTDKTQLLSSGKAIQTSEELYLLVKIYISTGHADEAVKLLQSEAFGPKSHFADRDPQLLAVVLLEALQAAGAWDEAFVHCRERLLQQEQQHATAGTPDDGKIWLLLIKAAASSNNPNLLKIAGTTIKDTLQRQNGCRNAHQALLSIIQIQQTSTGTGTELLQACENYWQKFQRKAYCFEDLKEAIAALEPSNQQILLDRLSHEGNEAASNSDSLPDRYTPDLNLLKLRYCFLLPVEASNAKLEKYAYDGLELYKTSIAGASRCPEAALLSVMALVRLAFAKTTTLRRGQYLLQAMCVLEACRSITKDYYPYSLLLLQLKSFLGLMSLAMKDFQGLNIKNIQWETTGHLLLTRISTTHPHVVGGSTPSADVRIEPLRALRAALTVSGNAGDSLSTQIRAGLKNGSYVNVIESVSMRSDLENSLSKQIFLHEEVRIKRLLSLPDVDDIPPLPSHVADNRDFSYLPKYDAPGAPGIREILRSGPLPQEQWLSASTVYESTIRFLNGELYGHRAPLTKEIELLQAALAAVKDVSTSDAEELTTVELDNLKTHVSLANAVLATKEASSSGAPNFDESITDIERWLQNNLPNAEPSTNNSLTQLDGGIQVPSWVFLHQSFSILGTLQAVSLFLAVLARKPKTSKSKNLAVPKARLTSLWKLVAEVEASVHDDARRTKAELNKAGVLGKLMDLGMGRNDQDELGPIGNVLEGVADAATLETFSGDMRDSWEDALDGILAVKVKILK